MMPDFPLGQTLDFKFTTRQFSSGAPFALVSGAVEVYEDNSITQIVAGETLTVNFDGVTGLNNLRIVATGANGYETGKSYAAILSGGTVDSVSVVGEVIAQFSIERGPALRPTTSGRTIDVLATGEVPIDIDTSIGSLAAAQIEATALNGKGDWNIGKTGYALTQAFPTNFADLSIVVTSGLIDITQAAADKVWGTAARILTASTNFNDISVADILDEDMTGHQAQGTLGQTIGDSVLDANSIYDAVVGLAVGATISADVASIKAETALIVADTNELQVDDVPGLIAALNDISVADILGGTISELGADPGIAPTLSETLSLFYMAIRNKRDTTATADEIHNNAGTVILTAALSDDGTIYSKAKYA